MSETTNNKTDWSKRDIGALWKRKSATQTYLSGYVKVDEFGLEKQLKVIVFSNKSKKDNEKAPDFRIYVAEDKSSGQETVAAATQNVSAKTVPTKSVQVKKAVTVVEEEEDIL